MTASIPELQAAVVVAVAKVRESVHTWGLDPLGVSRFRAVCWAMLKATAMERRLLRFVCTPKLEEAIRQALVLRVQNIRSMREATELAFQQTRNADWLAQWHMENRSDISGPVTGSILAAGNSPEFPS